MSFITPSINQNQQPETGGPYYFSHIPKTAGTSFTVILDRFFALDEILAPQLWKDIGEVKKIRKQDFKLIRGHFGAAGHVLSRQKLKVLTLLRNPVAMAYSTYLHIKRDNQTNVHEYVMKHDLSFEQFIADERTQNLANNRLIKSLSFGLGLEQRTTDFTVNSDNYKDSRKTWNSYRKTLSPDELLQTMKTYLDDCLWFGLQENFELSLSMLCYKMCWPAIGITTKLNTNHNSHVVSDEATELLRELNPLDFEFYDYAKIKFEQQVESFYQQLGVKGDLPAQLDQLVDEHYQLNYAKTYHQPLRAGLSYDFSQVLLGKNWHRREWSADEKMYFRWTGPKNETTIDFWLRPANYEVCISLVNIIDTQLLNHLKIKINEQAVDLSITHDGNKGKINFDISHELFNNNGLIRISMLCEELMTHDSVFNSGDNRKVGLAVGHIAFKKSGT